jgi:hypothetical protein
LKEWRSIGNKTSKTRDARPKAKKIVILVSAAVAVCVCIVVFGLGLDGQRARDGAPEQDGVGADVSATPGLEPAEPAGVQDDGESPPAGEVPVSEEEILAAQEMLRKLIDENSAKLERKAADLVEMEAMLDLLTEMNDDPDRIERYGKLIEDTKKEMSETEDRLARYEEELIKE